MNELAAHMLMDLRVCRRMLNVFVLSRKRLHEHTVPRVG